MQRPMTSKFVATIAMTAGAAALTLLGSCPAGAADMQPAAAPGAVQDAGYVYGKVVSNIQLNIRHRPTTHSAVLGALDPGAIIRITCKVNSENVDGNPRWYKLYHQDGWVAARYVVNLGDVPWC
jgi:hypothetical protein